MRHALVAPLKTVPSMLAPTLAPALVLAAGLVATGCASSGGSGSALPPAPSGAAAAGGGVRPLSQGFDEPTAASGNGATRVASANAAGATGDDSACNAGAARGLIGEQAGPNTGARARAATGSANVRVIGPNDFVTQDNVPSRLNVDVDSEGMITAVRCG